MENTHSPPLPSSPELKMGAEDDLWKDQNGTERAAHGQAKKKQT